VLSHVVGVGNLPSPSSSFRLPSLLFPLFPIPSTPFSLLLRGVGKRWSSPKGSGWSPAVKRILAHSSSAKRESLPLFVAYTCSHHHNRDPFFMYPFYVSFFYFFTCIVNNNTFEIFFSENKLSNVRYHSIQVLACILKSYSCTGRR